MSAAEGDKVRAVIDGREVDVEPGTTILTAARRLGIEIPTLCHVEGLEPSSSCFLCCVQVEGHRTLSPACAMPVTDGMVVDTAGDDVRASRKMALELLLSDHAGDCVAPCAARCPAGLDIPGYVYQIAAGRARQAMDVISAALSLPGTLGRVCPRLCEQSCRRCGHDESLAIAALHRWAADQTHGEGEETPYAPPRAPAGGKSVAIVGAGPAGLTAAFYLLQEGHAATLYDAQPLPGGMLRYGIPAYRLPRAALDAEIDVIRRLGAEFRMNVRLGRDFSLAELRESHDAVFVAIGAQQSRGLRCEGEELALAGLELLERVAKGEVPAIGERVAVIGGGNTAMDAARTAVRLSSEVRVLYRRTQREMPCLMEEVEGAEAEGVELDFLVAPARLARLANGRLELVCQRMELGEPDASGRRSPRPVAGATSTFECDTVIAAVGQAVDLGLAESEGLTPDTWGIRAHPRTLATHLPGVFAGGDAVLGADLAVRAVAAGRLAAASIGQYLAGERVVGLPEMANVALHPIDDAERAALFRAIEEQPRVPTAMLGMGERRTSFEEVDGGLGNEQALEEARRCLSCGCRQAETGCGCSLRNLATEYGADPTRFLGQRRRFERDASHPEILYEPGKCILCDACVRVAAEAREEVGVAIIGRGFDVAMAVPFDEPLSEGLRKVAERCAEACPTGALMLRSARACDLAGGEFAPRPGREPLVSISPL